MSGPAYNARAYRRLVALVRATGPPCWLCHRPGSDTLDHVHPVSKGGSSQRANLRPAHQACNSARGNRRPVVVTPLRRSRDW